MSRLVPAERKINATVDVTFTPLEDTRSVSFELNGSLKVDTITRVNKTVGAPIPMPKTAGKPATPNPATAKSAAASTITFVQDQTNSTDLGPHVRVDLGDNVVKGTPVTLRFKYSGILDLPAGGPLLTKRLAYIGDNQGYLMYAARWFPFHDYAADPATSDITISLPSGLPVSWLQRRSGDVGGRKISLRPGALLPDRQFRLRQVRSENSAFGGYELQFFAKPGQRQQHRQLRRNAWQSARFLHKDDSARRPAARN